MVRGRGPRQRQDRLPRGGAWRPRPAPPAGPALPSGCGSHSAPPPPPHRLLGRVGPPCFGVQLWGEHLGAQNRNRSRPQRQGQTVVRLSAAGGP